MSSVLWREKELRMPASTPIDGIVSIHKEAGWTSHDVVARVRRIAGQRRVGHAGTLDPAATGVLPVCLGQATRVVEYLSDSGKAYRATIVFGVETDTYDAEGTTTAQHDVPATLDRAAIEAALPQFLGYIMQVPPAYSALKRDGKRLYDLARAGIEVIVEPRPVRIDSLEIIAWESPTLTLDVACGKGTYIRSLAFDLGRTLGPGAHLGGLIRTRSGPFTLAQSVTLAQLEAAKQGEQLHDLLFAPDEALLHFSAAILGEENERRTRQGQRLLFPHIAPGDEPMRAYSTDGRFLAILSREDATTWHPSKVFDLAASDESPLLHDEPPHKATQEADSQDDDPKSLDPD